MKRADFISIITEVMTTIHGRKNTRYPTYTCNAIGCSSFKMHNDYVKVMKKDADADYIPIGYEGYGRKNADVRRLNGLAIYMAYTLSNKTYKRF